MKKALFITVILILALLAIVGCSKEVKVFDSNSYTLPSNTSALGDFAPDGPAYDEEVVSVPTFSWTAAENATSYTLEIASSKEFNKSDDKAYFSKTGITTTSFDIGAALKSKNQYYYWRVTALNDKRKKKVFTIPEDARLGLEAEIAADPQPEEGEETVTIGPSMRFYYKAQEKDSVMMDVAYADEWTVHEVGSKATVSVDKSNFFGNNKDAVQVAFVEEDTNRGEGYEDSDGWVVVTHAEEMELYGLDAFYFNFYYAGDDADVYFRVVDEDNEYWHAPVKLANNAKQTVIIRKDEFTLRTKGNTNIANQKFDFEYLKSFEFVFEHSFGDGIALFSDLRIIDFEDYKDRFIDSIDFGAYEDSFVHENYNFGTTIEKVNGVSSLTYSFDSEANEANDEGIQGYGFIRMTVERLLARGDAFAFHLELGENHLSPSHAIAIRIIEEDSDRWAFTIPVSEIPSSGDVVIPYTAFSMSEFKGDGFRQFYYLKELQIGLDGGVYSSGVVTISDFRVISIADYLESKKQVAYHSALTDGVIDDFENYDNSIDLYYMWHPSTVNKDEQLRLDEQLGIGEENKVGAFYYKTNMEAATYTIGFDAIEENPYNAIEIWAKDFSVTMVQMDDGSYRDVSVNAFMTVTLTMDSDASYAFTATLGRSWARYQILFDKMTYVKGSGRGQATIDPARIVSLTIGFSDTVNTFGYNSDKNYVTGSYVCLDNVRFIALDSDTSKKKTVDKTVKSGSGNRAVVDTFDTTTSETLDWYPVPDQDDFVGAGVAEVNASGTGKSAAFKYKTRLSAEYYTEVSVDSTVEANGIRLLMKAAAAAIDEDRYLPSGSVILELKNGADTCKYKADFSNLSEDWTYYTFGFGTFTLEDGEGIELTAKNLKNLTRISLVFNDYVNAPEETYVEGVVYLDEVTLDKNIGVNTKSAQAYTK